VPPFDPHPRQSDEPAASEVVEVAYTAAVTEPALGEVVVVAYTAAVPESGLCAVVAAVDTAAVAGTALCEVVAVVYAAAVAKTAACELVAVSCRAWNVQEPVVCSVAQYQHVDWSKLQRIHSTLESHNQYGLDIT